MEVPAFRLILITHRQQMPLSEYLKFIELCALSGITSLQLREKNMTPEFALEFSSKLKIILDPLNIPLIINDDASLASRMKASGVHLGQTDGKLEEARNLIGPDKIFGLSIESMENLEEANQNTLDYVAASAVFSSKNKENIKKIWELEGLSLLAKKSKHPVVAIGNINLNNIRNVLTAGASGVAVIGAIHDAPDPILAVKNLRKIIDQHFKNKEVKYV